MRAWFACGAQNLAVSAHWATEQEEYVQRAPTPLRQRSVTDGARKNRNVEVATSQTNVREALLVLSAKYNVIHKNTHLPFHAALLQLPLLVQQAVHERLVPFGKHKARVEAFFE